MVSDVIGDLREVSMDVCSTPSITSVLSIDKGRGNEGG
jgi:hypothetical protein